MMMKQRLFGAWMAAVLLAGSLSVPVTAQADPTYRANAQYHHRTYFQRHPYQKGALAGGAIGGAAGGLLGGGKGLVRGAIVGGAAGTGYQYWKKHR